MAGGKLKSCEPCARACRYERAIAWREIEGELVGVCELHRDGGWQAKLSRAEPDFSPAPYQRHSASSRDGARKVASKAADQSMLALSLICAAGEYGITEEDLRPKAGWDTERHVSTRAIAGLHMPKEGHPKLARIKCRRKSKASGVNIQVYVATQAGLDLINQTSARAA